MNVTTATILICTYNRAPLLRETLAALQGLAPACDYSPDILVVDNNSTDNTRQVVEEASSRPGTPIHYLSEPRQGKSFALNTGLAHVRGEIVALTDDDVLPDPEWLNRIVATFRARDVTFVFGKVHPRWTIAPPPELLIERAQDIWGPLAIVDYGDAPVEYRPEHTGQRLPIGANLAFTRDALVAIGGWRTDLGKVNNTLISGEDHEIFLRLQRFNMYAGYYDPAIAVYHFVPAARLTREYFRKWFYWSGKTHALMLADLYPSLDMATVPKWFGVPRFIYRQAAEQLWNYVRKLGRGDALGLLVEELRTLQYAGLFAGCWRRDWLTPRQPFADAPSSARA